ncbi:hypothetical protein JCM8097_009307 [Rhodosporidiobolus ruineniae]
MKTTAAHDEADGGRPERRSSSSAGSTDPSSTLDPRSRSSSRSLSPAPTLVGDATVSSGASTKSTATKPLPSPRSRRFFASSSTSSTPSHTPASTPQNISFPPSSLILSSRASSSSSARSGHSAASLDSVWDLDFETHWEWRQREDARRLAELKGATPYLSLGSYPNEHFRALERRKRRRIRMVAQGEGEGEGMEVAPTAMGSTASALGREEAAGEDEEERKDPHLFFVWLDNNRREVRRIMRLKRLHLIIIGLVAFDLVIVIVELIVALLTAGCMSEEVYEYVLEAVEHSHHHLSPASFACTMAPSHSREALENAIFGINISLLSVFMTEVLAAVYAFGPVTYCTSWVTLLDGFVVVTTLCLDVYFHMSKDPAAKSPIAVVILRLWKIFRAIHAIGHALSLHFEQLMEASEEGRKKLEMERMTESIRLNYVRNALIRATGSDVDPVLIEDEVQRERAAIERKRVEEEKRVYDELRSGSM